MTGIVPPNATNALFGLRIDTECRCSGRGEMLLGPANYRDDSGRKAERQLLGGPLNEPQRIRADPKHPLLANSAPFSVTANRHFLVIVPIDATAEMTNSGYLALIFLDASGKEIRRLTIVPTPSDIPLPAVTTTVNGQFEFEVPEAVARETDIQAEYAGSDRFRGSRTTAPH